MKWTSDKSTYVVDLPADVASVHSLSEHVVYTPVVRCGECRFASLYKDHEPYCFRISRIVDVRDFCSCGERDG
ncbi:MAG: hypothetical protein IJ113_06490 [Eggerthellaceae bacterium]|nr:hypothetical protein [Eggerthellaceae bacterium]